MPRKIGRSLAALAVLLAAAAGARSRPAKTAPPRTMTLTLTPTKGAALAAAYARMVAVHPDGKRFATALPGAIWLWDGERELRAITASPVQGLAFSSDGKLLLAAPHAIELRGDADPSGDVLAVALNHGPRQFEVAGSALSSDGKELVVAASYRPPRGIGRRDDAPDQPEHLLLLDARTHQLRRALWRGSGQRCTALALSAHHLAAADVEVWLWTGRGGAHRTLEGTTHKVRQLAFSPDGKLLAAVEASGMATLWDAASGKSRAHWKITDDNAPVLAFHPTEPVLATAAGDGAIKLWRIDLATAEPALLGSVTDQGPVEGLAFSPTGDRLLTATDGHPRFYDVTLAR